jgi:hypothetical protein
MTNNLGILSTLSTKLTLDGIFDAYEIIPKIFNDQIQHLANMSFHGKAFCLQSFHLLIALQHGPNL